jgi:hypothetical protein
MTTTRSRLGRAVAVPLVVVLSCAPAGLAVAADPVAFAIEDPRITESSGLATDREAGAYWTVNDSGAQGTVYGLNSRGAVRSVLSYRAAPVDVEAVAVHDGRLYVADIGDNGGRRPFVSVHFFDNPPAGDRTVAYRSYDFAYPDGPHDAETLLVDGSGRLYLVTKGLQAGIYVAPAQPSRQGVNQLRRVADAPAYVTDGVFLPGGRQIALRTYVSVLLLDAQTYRVTARDVVPLQRQGESLTVSLDGRSLLIGSEGRQSPVLQIPVPAAMGDVPDGANQPPSASPTATPSQSQEDPDPDDVPTPQASRTGSILALSLAGLVALVAGVVVAARRSA